MYCVISRSVKLLLFVWSYWESVTLHYRKQGKIPSLLLEERYVWIAVPVVKCM